MKLLSFSTRAISSFNFDVGISTRRCFDAHAFRIRVSMSATGSVIVIRFAPRLGPVPTGPYRTADNHRPHESGFARMACCSSSPTCLANSGDHPIQGLIAETDPAVAELPEIGPRPATPLTPVVLPDAEFGLSLGFLDHCFTRHALLLPSASIRGPPLRLWRRHPGRASPARATRQAPDRLDSPSSQRSHPS